MQRFRRLSGFVGVVCVLIVAWVWWPETQRDPPVPSALDVRDVAVEARTMPAALADSPTMLLNAPHGTIHDDVRLLQEVFAAWQTNFPTTGNPVGSNAEITAALCGDNALQLDLIPRAHPAINVRRELCDRWGTPFRFHQLSGTEMQVISAGPDRDFATADDVVAP